jgi:hypothetical protein
VAEILANIGTAGSSIDASAPDEIVRIVGPAVWFPNVTSPTDSLTSPGFTIPNAPGILPLPFTDGALTITASDIPSDATITFFTASTGQQVTVNRTVTSEPRLMIVPAEVITMIATTALDAITTPASATFDIAANQDAVIVWCGQRSNVVAGDEVLFSASNWQITATDTAIDVVFTSTDSTIKITSMIPLAGIGTNTPLCVVAYLDRLTATVSAWLYGPAGVRSTAPPVPIGALPDVSASDGGLTMSTVAGTTSSWAFHTGELLNMPASDIDAIADYLLFGYTATSRGGPQLLTPFTQGALKLRDPASQGGDYLLSRLTNE